MNSTRIKKDRKITVAKNNDGSKNLRLLRKAIAEAFRVKRPVFAMIYHAYYNVCIEHPDNDELSRAVRAGLLQGVMQYGNNEVDFNETASRIGNAMTFTNIFFAGYKMMVIDTWRIIQMTAANKIQQEWRFAAACPGRSLCRKRLAEEWLEMKDTLRR